MTGFLANRPRDARGVLVPMGKDTTVTGRFRTRSGRRARPAGAPPIDPAVTTVGDFLAGDRLTALRKLDVIKKCRGRLQVSPDDSLLRVWGRYKSRADVVVTGSSFFRDYRRIRSILEVKDELHPDWVLRAYIDVFGPAGVTRQRIKHVLGGNSAYEDACERLDAMVGRAVKRSSPRIEGTAEELFEILPPETRSAFEAYLGRELFPPIPAIHPLHVSRVRALSGDPLRLMGALAVIDATANRRAIGTIGTCVRAAEMHSSVLKGLDQLDGAAISAAFSGFMEDPFRGISADAATVTMGYWTRMHLSVVALAKVVLKSDAWRILDLLPACPEFPDPLRGVLAERSLAMQRRWKDPSPETVTRVVGMVERLIDIQPAMENRVFQLEHLLSACIKQMPKAVARAKVGLEAAVEWTGPVIRADGSLGDGDQRVRFKIVRESVIFEETYASGGANHLEPYLACRVGGTVGKKHDPAKWGRLHVVYDRTEPVMPGGEWCEPFFIQYFRWGAFEGDAFLTDEVNRERIRILGELGAPQWVSPIEGLLGHPSDRRHAAIVARGDDPATGRIVIPLVEFYHSMAYARVAARYCIRWGARIGETLQLRIGCVKTHDVGGVEKPYVELKPKGWDIMGKFGLDHGTAKAIREVRALTNARWHGRRVTDDGKPWLPVVRSGQRKRRNINDAAFLFQNEVRALRYEEITFFIRVLLHGVVDLRSHDGRRVFATALGLDGVGYEEIGVLLHHSPMSAMPARYDVSGRIMADDAAERFNASTDASALGLIAGG